jgi:hypothetical protein|tara:strand:- start:3149 stop:3325 length:177 start_codon:yes stop_codon:yes gene_type:complete
MINQEKIVYLLIAIVIAVLIMKSMEKYREYNTGEIKINPNASVFDIVKQIEDAKKKED